MDVYEPLVKGGEWIESITEQVSSYSHETLAIGGFWTAQIVINLPLIEAEDWFSEGLGRRIVIRNPAGLIVWEGFVDKITIGAGTLTETRGPLMEVGNRVSAVYTPLDVSVYPPVSGTTTITTISEDTASQALYGILEKVIGAGSTPLENAEKVREVYLLENAIPQTSGGLNITPGSSQSAVITLDCLGYIHWLLAYIFNDATAGYDFLSDKIIAVLAGDPNGFVSSNTDYIEANSYLTPTLENQNRFAWDILKELITLGNDTDDTRRIFGVYEERIAVYASQPQTAEYHHRLTDPGQVITTPEGELIYPWDIRPGKWIFVPDFLVGYSIPASLGDDPRAAFLESVRYSTAWGLTLTSGANSRLAQVLAKITYSGGFL